MERSSEQALIDRWVRHRDAEAFAEIVSRHAGMVFGTCRRILRNSTEAEDVAQDCFLRLMTIKAAAYPFLAEWLHKLATYRSLDRLRQTRRRRAREDEFVRSFPAHVEPDWSEIEPYVDEAIAALPDDVRAIVVRHFLEGQSYSRLAESLGLPRSTLARRCQEGIAAIRESLGRRGITTASAGLAAVLTRKGVETAPETLMANLGKVALAGTTGAVGEAVPITLKTAMLGGAIVAKKTAIATAIVILSLGILYEGRAPILQAIQRLSGKAVSQDVPPPAFPEERKAEPRHTDMTPATPARTDVAMNPADASKRTPVEVADQDLASSLLQDLSRWGAAHKSGSDRAKLPPFRSNDIPADNGAHYLLLAVELMPEIDKDWVDEMFEQMRANGWSEDPKLLALFEACRASLDAIHTGLEVGNAMMPEARGIDEPLPYLTKLRTLSRVMDLEAQMYAAHGDYSAALNEYADVLAFGTQAGSGGTVVGHLVGNAMSTIAAQDVSRTLEWATISPQEYRDFATRIWKLQSSQYPVSESVRLEAEGMARWLQDPWEFQVFTNNQEMGYDEATRNTVAQASPEEIRSMKEGALRAYRELPAYFSLPYYKTQDFDIESIIGDNPMARAVWESLDRVPLAQARYDTELTGTALVASIEAFRAENGTYPASLEALPAGSPARTAKDPFTGTTFRYTLTESGYLLYSAGSDMRDDGGVRDGWNEDGSDFIIHN